MSRFWRDGDKQRGRLRANVDRLNLKKPTLTRPLSPERQCVVVRDAIRDETAQLLRVASALSTQTTAGSYWSFWTLFADWAGIDVELFASSSDPPHNVLEEEENALVAFQATVCLYPRTKRKKSKKETRN